MKVGHDILFTAEILIWSSIVPTSHNRFIFCCSSMRLPNILIAVMDAVIVLFYAFGKSLNPSLDRHHKSFLTPCKMRMESKTRILGTRITTVLVIISYSTIKLK